MDAGRLIIHRPAAGTWNMAVDEALLESASRSGQCTLRFYQWSKPTLSLGYFQALDNRESHAPSEFCEVVRRSTGGGAILHDLELTYSFSSPIADRISSHVGRFYRAFHETLADCLDRESDVTAELCDTASPVGDSPFLCFQRRAVGDVLIRGQKVVGSAQRRRQGALLQHGSILLARSTFAPELPGINDLSPIQLQPRDLITPWARALEDRLGVFWREGMLDESECQMAGEIETARHATEAWIGRR